MSQRREFLMLATPINLEKHKIAGYYCSEKLDGGRCFWDGGVSRGAATVDVPWAGVLDAKTGQPKKKIKPVATGLWSRYGNPIIAPDWWLNTLPSVPLDGELWAGRGNFQKVMSYIKKDMPIDEEWEQVQFGVFGTPNIKTVMMDGEIKNSNFIKSMVQKDNEQFIAAQLDKMGTNLTYLQGQPVFSAELANLNEWIDSTSDTHFLIQQTRLSDDENEARAYVEAKKKEVIHSGGEGLFLRHPESVWVPKRVKTSLKIKGELDDEGVVTGFVSGRETNKGSKLLGLIGAVVLDYNGERLELSGFTDEERQFADEDMRVWAENNPGEEMPSVAQGKHFKVGDYITFKYRELTDKGLPKEARFDRKRNEQ